MPDRKPFTSLSSGRRFPQEIESRPSEVADPFGSARPAGVMAAEVSLPEEITCPRCESDLGFATNESLHLIQFMRAPQLQPGNVVKPKWTGWACANCLQRGIFTKLIETTEES